MDLIDEAQLSEEFGRMEALRRLQTTLNDRESQLTDPELGCVICVDCDAPIPAARLSANPRAVRCIDCQREYDRVVRQESRLYAGSQADRLFDPPARPRTAALAPRNGARVLAADGDDREAEPCESCVNHERIAVPDERDRERCVLDQPGFPRLGERCSAFAGRIGDASMAVDAESDDDYES